MYVFVERLLLILPSMHYKRNIILITILIYPEITHLISQKSQTFLKGKKIKSKPGTLFANNTGFLKLSRWTELRLTSALFHLSNLQR